MESFHSRISRGSPGQTSDKIRGARMSVTGSVRLAFSGTLTHLYRLGGQELYDGMGISPLLAGVPSDEGARAQTVHGAIPARHESIPRE
jgi:hypothetical protein